MVAFCELLLITNVVPLLLGNRHIAVRDFLRTHPDIALEYGELKMELAYRFSEDIEGYCTGKDAFVKQLEKDALLWYQNNESYKTR